MDFYFNNMHYLFEDDASSGDLESNAKNVKDAFRDKCFQSAMKEAMGYKVIMNTDMFANIRFPQVPSQFNMLMMDIDMPKKFNNINGEMNLHPLKMVLGEEDVAYAMFGNIKGLSMVSKPSDSDEEEENENIDYRYEEFLNEDDERGEQDKARTKLRYIALRDVNPEDFDSDDEFIGNALSGISNYVNTTLARYQECLQLVSGTNQDTKIAELVKTIKEADTYCNDYFEDWLKENIQMIKQKQSDSYQREKQLLKLKELIANLKTKVLRVIATSKVKWDSKRIDALMKELNDADDRLELVASAGKYGIKVAENDNVTMMKESADAIMTKPMNEAEVTQGNKEDGTLTIDAQKMYDLVYGRISTAATEILSTRATSWESVTASKTMMDEIIKSADEEINSMISIVTRTGDGTKDLDIPDKFKAVFSKYPMDAAYFKNMWSRFKKDLETRRDRKIADMTSAKGRTVCGMLTEWCTNTYPRIITMMLVTKYLLNMVLDTTPKEYFKSELFKLLAEAKMKELEDNLDAIVDGIADRKTYDWGTVLYAALVNCGRERNLTNLNIDKFILIATDMNNGTNINQRFYDFVDIFLDGVELNKLLGAIISTATLDSANIKKNIQDALTNLITNFGVANNDPKTLLKKILSNADNADLIIKKYKSELGGAEIDLEKTLYVDEIDFLVLDIFEFADDYILKFLKVIKALHIDLMSLTTKGDAISNALGNSNWMSKLLLVLTFIQNKDVLKNADISGIVELCQYINNGNSPMSGADLMEFRNLALSVLSSQYLKSEDFKVDDDIRKQYGDGKDFMSQLCEILEKYTDDQSAFVNNKALGDVVVDLFKLYSKSNTDKSVMNVIKKITTLTTTNQDGFESILKLNANQDKFINDLKFIIGLAIKQFVNNMTNVVNNAKLVNDKFLAKVLFGNKISLRVICTSFALYYKALDPALKNAFIDELCDISANNGSNIQLVKTSNADWQEPNDISIINNIGNVLANMVDVKNGTLNVRAFTSLNIKVNGLGDAKSLAMFLNDKNIDISGKGELSSNESNILYALQEIINTLNVKDIQTYPIYYAIAFAMGFIDGKAQGTK